MDMVEDQDSFALRVILALESKLTTARKQALPTVITVVDVSIYQRNCYFDTKIV